MRNLTHRWTQSRHFFQNKGTFFNFQKRAERHLLPLASCAPGVQVKCDHITESVIPLWINLRTKLKQWTKTFKVTSNGTRTWLFYYHFYLLWTAIHWLGSKLRNAIKGVFPAGICLLTLNRCLTSFWCFHYWNSASKYQLDSGPCRRWNLYSENKFQVNNDDSRKWRQTLITLSAHVRASSTAYFLCIRFRKSVYTELLGSICTLLKRGWYC